MGKEEIIIQGSLRLKGTVQVQGAKNAAMKHILMPLLTQGIFKLKNVPRIGSVFTLIKLIEHQGAIVEWLDEHSLEIDTTQVNQPKVIPSELFYYTSAGIHCLPILASRFGECSIELKSERDDWGGCQIGSRSLDLIIESLKLYGISADKSNQLLTFKVSNEQPFAYQVPKGSFSASVNSLYAALFKKGKSIIRGYTREAEFDDILRFLIQAGARITKEDQTLLVEGPTTLKPIEFAIMKDRQDVVTWISIALATNSELTIEGVQYELMRLDSLEPTLKQMGVEWKLEGETIYLPAQLERLKPVKLLAGIYPMIQTEWQVLFAPLLTQINGVSEEVETWHTKRMEHWKELGKMGAKYQYFRHPDYPEVDGSPRAVKVSGPVKLHGAEVRANDVRSGAALVIAGLIAKGETKITNIHEIDRGYENLVGRLQAMGAQIRFEN